MKKIIAAAIVVCALGCQGKPEPIPVPTTTPAAHHCGCGCCETGQCTCPNCDVGCGLSPGKAGPTKVAPKK